jgi:hypothetical protein
VQLAAALIAAALTLVGATGALASPVAVGPATPLSGASPFPADCGGPGDPAVGSEVEPHLAVDPSDPRRLLAGWQQDRHTVYGGARGNAGAVSRDGGRSFSALVYPGLTRCGGGPRDRSSDPWVSIGADGTAYASHLTFDYLEPYASADLGGPTQLVAQTSTDGGRTFGAPVTVVDEGQYDDRQAHTADPYRPGRAYMVWSRRLGAFGETGTTEFSKTEDGGRTWTPHRTIHVPGPGRLTIPSLIDVMPDGALVASLLVIEARYAVSSEPVTFEIVSVRSTDGGETWSSPVRIGETLSTQPEDPDGRGGLRALPVIATAGARDGTLYVAWNVIRSTEGSEIRLSRSSDGGRSWSEPAIVASPAGQAFLPAVVVDERGTVGVLWDDTRNDRRGDEPFTTDVWFAHSHDRGSSWDEVRVAGPFDALTAAPTSSTAVAGRFLGDYQAVVPQPDGFAALFPQAQPAATTGPTDVFAARLTLSGEGAGAAPRLRLSVRPRVVRAGRRTRFRFRVTRRDGGRAVAVRGAAVRFAGRRVRTGRRGQAVLAVRFARRGRRRAVATRPGFRRARATVYVLRRR